MEQGTLSKADKAQLYLLIEGQIPDGVIPLSIQEAIDNASEPLDVYSALQSLLDRTRLAQKAVEQKLGSNHA